MHCIVYNNNNNNNNIYCLQNEEYKGKIVKYIHETIKMLSTTCVVVHDHTVHDCDNQLPNAVAQAIWRNAQYVLPYMAGVIFVKNIFQK